MSIFFVCGSAIGATVLILIVKQFKSEIAVPISALITVVLSLVSVALIRPITQYIKEISSFSEYGEYISVMMKSLGIALVSSSSADICRDCGENAIASKVELIGKCAIMLVTLPLVKIILELAKEMMYA